MKITAIKAQIKNAERVSIFVDGKYSFSLTHSQLLEHKIFTGKEVTEAELRTLQEASDYGKLLERVMNYVMIRPRSVREVRDYLWRKKAEPQISDRILSYVQSKKYVNDESFTKSWIRARQLTKPVSKKRLIAELRQKGVAQEIITATLANQDDEGYDETIALREMITKKRKLARYQDDQKLIAYLARQGFSFESIKNSLAESDENRYT